MVKFQPVHPEPQNFGIHNDDKVTQWHGFPASFLDKVAKVIDQLPSLLFPAIVFHALAFIQAGMLLTLQMVSGVVRLVKKNFKSPGVTVPLSHQQKTIPI